MSSEHGSDANAGCPSACVRTVSSVRLCDCVGVTTDITGITLIDGVIPMLDVSQTNWAAQLYTYTANMEQWNIAFQFLTEFMLRQVDLYLFFCPNQGIPNQGILSISVYQSILFPNAFKGLLLGNITLREGHNCVDLIEISIPTTTSSQYTLYLIEFSVEGTLGEIYMGELKFRDTAATATSPTTSATVPPTTSATVTPTTSATVPPTTSATVPPTTSATVPPTTSATVPPTTSATVPPTISATVPPTTSATVSPTTSATVPPTTSATVPPTTSATVPPTTSATVPPTTSATVPPTTSANVPPTTSATVPPTTSATVPPTTSATVPPTTSATVPSTTSATAPPTTSATVPPTTSAAVPPTTSATVPSTTSATVPPTTSATVPPTTSTTVPPTTSATVPPTTTTANPTNSSEPTGMLSSEKPESTSTLVSTNTMATTSSEISDTNINEKTTALASLPLTIVGGLVGVIFLLLVLITIGCVTAVLVIIHWKKKNKKELQHHEGTLLEQETNMLSMSLRMSGTETTLNSQYETTSFLKTVPNSKFPDSWKNGASANSQILDPCFNESTQEFFPFAESSTDTNIGNNMESDEGIYNEIGDFSSGVQAEASNVSDKIEAMVLVTSSSVTQGLDAGDQTDENATSVTNNTIQPLSKPSNNSDENVSNATTPHGTLTKSEAPRKRLYSIVKGNSPPKVPKKSVELYKALKMETETRNSLERPDGEGISPFYVSKITENNCLYSTVDDANKNPEAETKQYVGKYNMLMIGDMSTDEIYSEIMEKPIPHETSEQAHEQVLDSHFEQQNPLYSTQQATAPISSILDQDIYTLPDTQDSDDDNDKYDSVREHIQPSMFERAASTKHFKGDDIYAPVYDISTLNSTAPRPILSLKPDNIKKVKTIGTGFFGKVILADTINLSQKELNLGDNEDQKKSSRVAVKQLKSNPSSQAIEAFEKELKFMSRLDHENVIRVLGSCKGETTFIMMEYMENGDLNQYLMNYDNIVVENEEMDDHSVCANTLTRMITQIANGMTYLSSKNFIHRDLATRNCLVGKEMQVKIADFGMSRNLYQSHYYVLKGHAILPVRWMAKECFYGKFSTKTDVWAFGVTMWEIFTLAKDIPYEDMEDEEFVTDAPRKDKGRTLLAKPANCPANMYDIMLMCWKQEPKSRASFNTLFETLLPISTRVATSK